MYEVIIIKEGYTIKEGPGQVKSCGSVTLLKGPHNVIVDTGNPWDKELILTGLASVGVTAPTVRYVVCTNAHTDKIGNLNLFTNAVHVIAGEVCHGDSYLLHGFIQKHGLSPQLVEYVVCTHGHSDHVGNLNLFPNSIHIVSHDICVGDQYQLHDFKQGIPYEIDDDIEVVPTPGHTGSDVSVVVKNTSHGTVAVTGDLFECQEDLEDWSLWQENSENPECQQQSRIEILKVADWIIPGHGAMFKVAEDYKQQMKVVMFYEYSELSDGQSQEAKSDCVVFEAN